MQLTDPTDDQLNAAFAEKVAGWKRGGMFVGGDPTKPCGWTCHSNPVASTTGSLADRLATHWIAELPLFTQSADAVLPWLEKEPKLEIGREADGWLFVAGEFGYMVKDRSFARGGVIALLFAHGVEITFSR